MGALKAVVSALVLAAASSAHADPIDHWRPLIEEASLRFGVPTSWIERVIRAESRGQTTLNGRPIRSRAGAMGLMQIMPATWVEMRARLGLGVNPDDPRNNILAGTFYLRLMYDSFGYPGLFAAYNAGPGRYGAVLAGRARLPAETVGYLATVGGSPAPATNMSIRERPQMLFVVRRDPLPAPSDAAVRPLQPFLFAVRKDVP